MNKCKLTFNQFWNLKNVIKKKERKKNFSLPPLCSSACPGRTALWWEYSAPGCCKPVHCRIQLKCRAEGHPHLSSSSPGKNHPEEQQTTAKQNERTSSLLITGCDVI